MLTRPYLLHALSPLHVGTGQSSDIIDLPIARARSTGLPIVPGTGVKGVLREATDARNDEQPEGREKLTNEHAAIFGPETEKASEHSGALIVSDARLLALPVRSFKGTFAWTTSPLLLELAKRDLTHAPAIPPNVKFQDAHVIQNEPLNIHSFNNSEKLYLEDLDLSAKRCTYTQAWADWLAQRVIGPDAGKDNYFSHRFVIVDDETMTFLYETATQIDTRIRINPETGTVAKGALWYEESLPPETLLLGIIAAERVRRKDVLLQPQDVLDRVLDKPRVLQFGGKATVGRGRCRMIPMMQEASR